MATTTKVKEPKSTVSKHKTNRRTHEQQAIADKAYMLRQRGGCTQGYDFEDWFKAKMHPLTESKN